MHYALFYIDTKKKQIYISAGILCTSESTQLTSLLKWNKAGHCQTSSFYDFTKLPPHLQSRQARQGRCQNSIKMKIFAFIVSPVAALLFKHPPSIWQSLIVIGTFTSPQFQSRAPGLSSDNVIFKKFQIQYSSNCSNTSFYLTESDSDRDIYFTCSHIVSEITNNC